MSLELIPVVNSSGNSVLVFVCFSFNIGGAAILNNACDKYTNSGNIANIIIILNKSNLLLFLYCVDKTNNTTGNTDIKIA
jgi:hypothetical protein